MGLSRGSVAFRCCSRKCSAQPVEDCRITRPMRRSQPPSFIAAIAGAWWGELIPGNRPVATAAPSQPIAIAPVVKPRARRVEVSHRPNSLRLWSCDPQPGCLWQASSRRVRARTTRIESPPPKPVALSGACGRNGVSRSSELPRWREERVVVRRRRRCRALRHHGRRPSRCRRLQWPPWRTQR